MPAALPPPEAPPASPASGERPPVVPRAAAPAAPPAADPDADPPGYATVWPPVSKVRKAIPEPEPEPEPEAAAPPPLDLPPAAPAPPPVAEVPVDMAPPKPPPPPKPPREWPKLDRRAAGVGIAVLLIALAGLALVLIPKGGKTPQKAATLGTPTATATPQPTPQPKLAAQVRSLDALMRLSERGRIAAVNGDFAAAVANRTTLLSRIRRLNTGVRDARLKGGLQRFAAAVQEALRQNRTCKAGCETADLDKVGALKQAALKRLNPLLRRYAHTSYKRAQI
jgi:hypothetical protein